MKLIIAGSRTFNNYNLLEKILNYQLQNIKEDIEVVSGGQMTFRHGEKYGADYLGERYAKQKGFSIRTFLPNWKLHGKAAGPIRNKQMAEYATHCICFWDGKSKGTKSMIDYARQYNLKLKIIITTC